MEYTEIYTDGTPAVIDVPTMEQSITTLQMSNDRSNKV